MKRFLVAFFLFGLCISYGQSKSSEDKDTSVFYLIRHADKDLSDKKDRNPHLTEKGHKRAANWANLLKNVKLDAVYSTNYNRTKETAGPTAKSQNLEVNVYDPRNFNMKDFLQNAKGKKILIVGHSNSTPMFANGILGEEKYKMINESNYGRIYIVTVSNGQSSSMILQID